MWIAIIIIGVILLFVIIALSAPKQGQLCEVFDNTGERVFMGSMEMCIDYMETRRAAGYKGRFKTKKSKY